jgi:hypothetical protein
MWLLICLCKYVILLFLAIQLFRLPFGLAKYNVTAMPTFDATDLKAGDLVFLRWNDWYYTKLVSYWTHCMIIIDIDGTLYTAEIRGDSQLDALDGTMRQMCIRKPEDAITTYGGIYAVRRRVTPLTPKQNTELTAAVMSYRNNTYTSSFFTTYVASFTPFAWKYQNDGQAWCSLIIADWLKKAGISDMIHPCWVLPNDLASKWTPFELKNQKDWDKEQVPVW